jgi:hypothetical protein
MKATHPQDHPVGRTFGLAEAEVERIRRAARLPCWRYVLTDRRCYPLPCMAFIFGLMMAKTVVGMLTGAFVAFIIQFAILGSEWSSNRRIAKRLGY